MLRSSPEYTIVLRILLIKLEVRCLLANSDPYKRSSGGFSRERTMGFSFSIRIGPTKPNVNRDKEGNCPQSGFGWELAPLGSL
ncbi:hypothetical protein GCM10023155_46550 [Bremerella cremea]